MSNLLVIFFTLTLPACFEKAGPSVEDHCVALSTAMCESYKRCGDQFDFEECVEGFVGQCCDTGLYDDVTRSCEDSSQWSEKLIDACVIAYDEHTCGLFPHDECYLF